MIKHIFVGTLVPDAEEGDVDKLISRWRALADAIPGVRELAAGRNVAAADQRYSVGLVAEFEDMTACERYLEHPAHRAVSAELSSRLIDPKSRAVVQFEVGRSTE